MDLLSVSLGQATHPGDRSALDLCGDAYATLALLSAWDGRYRSRSRSHLGDAASITGHFYLFNARADPPGGTDWPRDRGPGVLCRSDRRRDRKSTRLNSSHVSIS